MGGGGRIRSIFKHAIKPSSCDDLTHHMKKFSIPKISWTVMGKSRGHFFFRFFSWPPWGSVTNFGTGRLCEMESFNCCFGFQTCLHFCPSLYKLRRLLLLMGCEWKWEKQEYLRDGVIIAQNYCWKSHLFFILYLNVDSDRFVQETCYSFVYLLSQ